MARAYFTGGASDYEKSNTFGNHEMMWRSIREDVKMWSLQNWARWEEERPDWFKDEYKSSLPDDFLPAYALRDMVMSGTRKRRKSISELLKEQGELGVRIMDDSDSGRESSLSGRSSAKITPIRTPPVLE
jgi:hypothetical protein